MAARPKPHRSFGGRHVVWCAVGGAPHISDLDGGKRPGTLEDSRNVMRLTEHYDVMHVQSPNVEAQDIDTAFRHFEVTRAPAHPFDQAAVRLLPRQGPGR